MPISAPAMRALMPAGFIKELARRSGCRSVSRISDVVLMEMTGSYIWPSIEQLALETNPEGFAAWQSAQQSAQQSHKQAA